MELSKKEYGHRIEENDLERCSCVVLPHGMSALRVIREIITLLWQFAKTSQSA